MSGQIPPTFLALSITSLCFLELRILSGDLQLFFRQRILVCEVYIPFVIPHFQLCNSGLQNLISFCMDPSTSFHVSFKLRLFLTWLVGSCEVKLEARTLNIQKQRVDIVTWVSCYGTISFMCPKKIVDHRLLDSHLLCVSVSRRKGMKNFKDSKTLDFVKRLLFMFIQI